MADLKRCQRCGTKPNLITHYSEPKWYQLRKVEYYKIKCPKCLAEMRSKYKQSLIRSWNRRGNDDKL